MINIKEILAKHGERFVNIYNNKPEFKEAIEEIINESIKKKNIIIKTTLKDLRKSLHNINGQALLVNIKYIIKYLEKNKN